MAPASPRLPNMIKAPSQPASVATALHRVAAPTVSLPVQQPVRA